MVSLASFVEEGRLAEKSREEDREVGERENEGRKRE